MTIAIAIPTLGRDEILLDTIQKLLELNPRADEIIIVDQSDSHSEKTSYHLERWHKHGDIQWIRIKYKSITNAMNIALRKAISDRVLFLDDDIIPDHRLLLEHINSSSNNPYAIIAGRVLQPWHFGKEDSFDEPFLFNGLEKREVHSFMGGNVSIPRLEAIRVGGFDTNFIRVAYHFEAEFAYRWKCHGNKIFYEPNALIHHLKTERGGTRSFGSHLTTIKPDHSVGRHYYYLCRYTLTRALFRSFKAIIKSIVTKHHLRNPLWIPATISSEIIGFAWAILLWNSGKGTIKGCDIKLLVVVSHPIQYYSPIFSKLDKSRALKSVILYLTLPNAKSQSLGFNHSFTWDIPLLNGYSYRIIKTQNGNGLLAGFFGVRIKKSLKEMRQIKYMDKPQIALITGWHFWGMVQMFIALKLSNIPIILRMDSNSLRHRNLLLKYVYKIFFSWVDICLCVGKRNKDFCQEFGISSSRIIPSPHVVDNKYFCDTSRLLISDLVELRSMWNIPQDSFCFLFAGKLQQKKRPLDLLRAFEKACDLTDQQIHLLIVGTGVLEDECKNFSRNHHLPVSFVGFLNQSSMPKAYTSSNCIVLPSDQGETWGLVINEAMACGLPAIVSDQVGCVPDLIRNGLTGFSYTCGDCEQLARYLVYMAENRDLSAKLGKNAQDLIHKEYTIDNVMQSIETAVRLING